jgi:FixJ family two-component response regulator
LNGNTVVVVEDDPIVLASATELFESAGLSVVGFANGDAARDYLLSDQRDVGALFTDVRVLGSTDGLALARVVAETCPHIAVVVTSGMLTEPPEGLPDSARYIEKPWLGVDVLNAIIDAQQRD